MTDTNWERLDMVQNFTENVTFNKWQLINHDGGFDEETLQKLLKKPYDVITGKFNLIW